MKSENLNGKSFCNLALYAFAGAGLEILLLIIEQMIYSKNFSQWNSIQQCTHLFLTSVAWGTIIFSLFLISKNKYDFNISNLKEKPNIDNWKFVILISIISVAITTILWGGVKPIKELQSNGLIIWLFQNIYYCFESGIILLIIIFGQKYGEIRFKQENMIYGGIFLSLSWGLIHMLTQGFATGIFTLIMSIAYGLIYLLLNKNIKFTYLIITLIFIL